MYSNIYAIDYNPYANKVKLKDKAWLLYILWFIFF